MDDARLPALESINFVDKETQECPYHAYRVLRDEAPVWFDKQMGVYQITRYDDCHMIVRDPETFPSSKVRGIMAQRPGAAERTRKITAIYQERGWVPGPTLASRDDPEHRQLRRVFDKAFRPSRLNDLEPWIEALCHRLIDGFIDKKQCDFVAEFAVPMPLIVIGRQMGSSEEDIWQIKSWTDAWTQRFGMMQSEEEAIWSTEQEIEFQHYFQKIFERLRVNPDDTLLSDLVNTPIPEWGRTLTDNELHTETMVDTFVGGSETSTNGISSGVMLLCQHPEVWAQLKSDPERYIPIFVEEVVRLEGPIQGLFRSTATDVELHGVTIPKDSVLMLRYAAANRDERQFEEPETLSLERENIKSHLAFGFGVHHCMGAPLARRELTLAFKAIVARLDEVWLEEPLDALEHHPNIIMRALKHLKIGFTPAAP